MVILGIETSCDDTAVAIVEATRQGNRDRFSILSSVVASQILTHKKTGGVVPEVAAREHTMTIMPTLEAALTKAGLSGGAQNHVRAHVKFPKKLNLPGQIPGHPLAFVDLIAATTGPGLITSLLVGAETGRTLAYAWDKPFVGVNHILGHLSSAWLLNQPIRFPTVALIVSGGHTELLLLRSKRTPSTGSADFKIQLLGSTRDDAAGEAFDKTAKLLGLGYPGGPALSKKGERGNPRAVPFPRPMIDSPNFDFSFAGLKTSVLYHLRDLKKLPLADVAASIERAIVDALVAKTARAADRFNAKTVIVAGGVAANRTLRQLLAEQLSITLLIPPPDLCTDNAAMIAAAGYLEFKRGRTTPWNRLVVDPNWEMA